MDKRQKIIVSIVGIFIVLLALIGLTYAYFLTRIQGNTNEKSISVTTANLRLVYGDGSDGVIGGTNIMPSDTVYSKTFTVKNEGTYTTQYAVYLINVINTFERKDDIKYTLSCTTDGDITCNEITNENTFPNNISPLVFNSIEPGKTHTYTLKFTYKDSGTDQSIDMNKTLSAKIQIYGKNGSTNYLPYEDGTLAKTIIDNLSTDTSSNRSRYVANLDSNNLAINPTKLDDKIITSTVDDYGNSYYYRGTVEDNYLSFAGMCFRIVRIEGDGSIKLILASELDCSEANLTNDSGYATDGAKGVKGSLLTAHYGYKVVDEKYINDYINSASDKENSARVKLNEWLERKITSDSDLALLKSDTWCIGDLTNGYSSPDYSIIKGKTIDELINENLLFSFSSAARFRFTHTPTLVCDKTGKNGEVDTNKVGMLTIDEIVYAGGGNEGTLNYYLNDNAKSAIWQLLTLDSYDFSGKVVYKEVVDEKGASNGVDYVDTANNIRPVIVLNNSVRFVSGDGTISNPYKVN